MPFWNSPPDINNLIGNTDYIKPLTKEQIIKETIETPRVYGTSPAINERLEFARIALSDPTVFNKEEIYRLEQIVAGYDDELPIDELENKFYSR
jgi:hypothetical protein